MHQDEELHAELMLAFTKYFKANQDWLTKKTKRAGMQTRYWLSEIRRICSARRKAIMDWRYAINELEQAQKEASKLSDTESEE